MNERENLIRRIRDCLAVYAVRVDMDKGEASRAAEDFYCGLLNLLMGYELQNMNRVKANYPAIDLGDAGAGLGVQVTSTATRKKVQDTLDTMFRNGVEERYPHLVMLVINKWTESRRAFRMDGVCRFDPERDIWDTDWLLKRIDGIPELEKLRQIQDYLTKHLHLVREPAPALNLPLRTAVKPEDFVGREAEMREIGQRFETERIVAVSGLGGIGKTELAVRFGQEYQDSGRGWAYMLHCRESFAQTLRDHVTQIIPDYQTEGRSSEQIADDALAALNRCGREDLLILDNADGVSMTTLRRELSALRMRVLVTTRKDTAGAVKVRYLDREALYAIFRRNEVEISTQEMDALIEAVDFHTLTVNVMAKTLRRGRRSATPEKLLHALEERDLAKGFTKVEIEYAGSEEQARINEHLKAVFRVAELPERKQALLRCCVFLPAGGMEDTLFLSPFDEDAGDTLDNLIEDGWLYMEEGLLRIHPVIRIVCIEELKPTEDTCKEFLESLRTQYDVHNHDNARCRQLAEVFTEASRLLEDPNGTWSGEAGYLWRIAGELQFAMKLEKQTIDKRECGLAAPEELATAYNNLGVTCLEMANYRTALWYMKKALKIRELILPDDHPARAESYNNIGNVYRQLNQPDEALGFCTKAMEIWERAWGKDHPNMAVCYDNIGCILSQTGQYEEAVNFHEKALKCLNKAKGDDQLELATCYDNLGCAYIYLKQPQKALDSCKKALQLFEELLDPDHHSIATACNNIAYACAMLEDFETARKHIARAVDIANRCLPEGNPDQRDYQQMQMMIERVMSMKEKGIKTDNHFLR